MIKFRVPTLAFQFWRFSKYLNQIFSVILKIACKWILTFGPPTNCINSFSLVLLFFKSISFHSCRYGGEPVPFKVVPCGMSLSTLRSNSYHSLLWGRLTGKQGMNNNCTFSEQKGAALQKRAWFAFWLCSAGGGVLVGSGMLYLVHRIPVFGK